MRLMLPVTDAGVGISAPRIILLYPIQIVDRVHYLFNCENCLIILPIFNYLSRSPPINYYKNFTLTITIGENFVPISPVSSHYSLATTTLLVQVHYIIH